MCDPVVGGVVAGGLGIIGGRKQAKAAKKQAAADAAYQRELEAINHANFEA